MARPQTVSDTELLDRIDAALTVRSQAGTWGLHEVAPAAGISPAGLVKRFGSKEGLLLALARRWIERLPDSLPDGAQPDEALRSYLDSAFAAPSAEAAVFALGELMGDLRTPESIALLSEGWAKQVRYLELLLRELDLPNLSDPHRGALLLLDALHGALYRHAVALEPTSPSDTLDHLLENWA